MAVNPITPLKETPGYTENPYSPEQSSLTSGRQEGVVSPPPPSEAAGSPPPAQALVREGFSYDPGGPSGGPQTQDVTGSGLSQAISGLLETVAPEERAPEYTEYNSVLDSLDFEGVPAVTRLSSLNTATATSASSAESYTSVIPSIVGNKKSGQSPAAGSVVAWDSGSAGGIGAADPRNFLATQPKTQAQMRAISAAFGLPLRITPHGGTQPDARSGTSQHSSGGAVDVYIADYTDAQKQQLVAVAIATGARGLGSYSAGDGKGTLHIDFRNGGKNFGDEIPGGIALWHRNQPGVDDPWTTGPDWYVNGIKDGVKLLTQGTQQTTRSVNPSDLVPSTAASPSGARAEAEGTDPMVGYQNNLNSLQEQLFSDKSLSLSFDKAIRTYLPGVNPEKFVRENWGDLLKQQGHEVNWFTMNLGHLSDIPVEQRQIVTESIAPFLGLKPPA